MLKKSSSIAVAAVLALSAAMPMTASAEKITFYGENPAVKYVDATAPASSWVPIDDQGNTKQAGWMSTYKGGGTIGGSTYGWDNVTDVQVTDREFLPTGKVFTNVVNSTTLNGAYYRFDSVGLSKYMSLNDSIGSTDGKEDYYIRWIMYVPGEANTSEAYGAARMSLALHSTNAENSSRYEAGVHYKYENGAFSQCELMFFDRGNGKWIYGKTIENKKWYNCLLKISAVKSPSADTTQDNASFKMWEYGTDEPAEYDISYDFVPKATWENLIVFQPYQYGIWSSTLHAFADFQMSGYTNDTQANDITDAEAVFAAAQAWNPQMPAEIRTADDLNNALSAATAPTEESGVTVTYAINKASDCLTVENNVFSLNRPEVWTELALEATFTKGNASTKKSYPLYIKENNIVLNSVWTKTGNSTAANCSAVVTNDTDTAIKPAVIFASYDAGDKLIDVQLKIAEEQIDVGAQDTFPAENLNITGADKVKTFVWKGMTELKPLVNGLVQYVADIANAQN